jgi:hypothetical protein
MAKFSARFKYDPRLPKALVFEDAPEGARTAYLDSILEPLTWEPRYSEENQEGRPLESYRLKKDFCAVARQEMPDFSISTTHWADLRTLLKGAMWFNFYDFVEAVGKSLKYAEAASLVPECFGFGRYEHNLNELFNEECIGWRLNDKSELEKHIPTALSKRLAATDKSLSDKFEPARKHYQKAIQYTLGTQPDPENAIKEVTSAVESVGRILYPNASTLGDVVKEMRKQGRWPSHLVTMIEKYYAYASSEPAIRHGATVSSQVLLADAEFCLHVGAAIIRYLAESSRPPNSGRTNVRAGGMIRV